MQETPTNDTSDVKLLKLGSHNSGTWEQNDLCHKGSLAAVCCSWWVPEVTPVWEPTV